MTTLSESEINAETLEACRHGDREAFRVLYETYKDKVYSISLYYFHGNPDLARDATQNAFLKVMTGIAQFRGESGFTTWLYRVVVNVCVDRSRSASSRETPMDEMDLGRQGRLASHENALAQEEEASAVTAALSTLPPKLRMPILLRYFDDLSYSELAKALDCSIGTVASRLNKGHLMLRRKLESLSGFTSKR